MTEPETTNPAPQYGLRCGDPNHGGFGQVHVKSQGRHQIEGLATSNRCDQLVVSHDGGTTWEAPDA